MKTQTVKQATVWVVATIVLAAATVQAASQEARPEAAKRRAESIVVEPGRIVPEPPPPVRPDYGFDVDIWTDRRTYEIGDLVRVYFRVTRPAYVYIFNTDTRGVTHQLFPNYYDQDSYCTPGRRYYIPDDSYKLRVVGPPGTEELRIVAVRYRPTWFERRYRFSPGSPFPAYPEGAKGFLREYQRERGPAGGENDERMRSRSRDQQDRREMEKRSLDNSNRGRREVAAKRPEAIVVEPNQPRAIVIEKPTPTYDREWAEAYTTVRVVDPSPRLRPVYYGRLNVTSSPSGARIEVDGRYRGRTPETVEYLGEGTHRIEVSLPGFVAWQGDVDVRADRTTSVHVRLRSQRPLFHFDFRF